jgi:hypothetical protein
VTERPGYRERAAHNLAAALVLWVAYRIGLVTTLLLTGLAPPPDDPFVAPAIERYGTLRGHVRNTGIVGYVGPTEPEPGHQMMARYTLAPLLLAPEDAHDLVVVDLDSDAALAKYVESAPATVLVHPRPGLAIVERQHRVR